ncbi:hypothetical protein AGMMS49982_18960 [Bacteroidia bacterium]|nr:hypothetical protein AGMMS49982_18960 [Bacteroidia bacterium]
MRQSIFKLFILFLASHQPAEAASHPGPIEDPDFAYFLTDTIHCTLLNKTELTAKYHEHGEYLINGLSIGQLKEMWSRNPFREIPENGDFEYSEMDLTQHFTYELLEERLLNLVNSPHVRLVEMGLSTRGRSIYMLVLGHGDIVIAKEGGTHSRETFNTFALVKQVEDYVNSLDTNAIRRRNLEEVTVLIAVCTNPDGLEDMLRHPRHFANKTNMNGVDINRNFFASISGGLAHGVTKCATIVNKPGNFYAGKHLGSEIETIVASKFVYYAVIERQAVIFESNHQVGNIIYAGKPYQTAEGFDRSYCFGELQKDFLNSNLEGTASKEQFSMVDEDAGYGFDGRVGTITDFACDLASGFRFCAEQGRMVYADDNCEMPLLEAKNMEHYHLPQQTKCAIITIEYGVGEAAWGHSKIARRKHPDMYHNYGMDKLLDFQMDYAGCTSPKLNQCLVSDLENTAKLFSKHKDMPATIPLDIYMATTPRNQHRKRVQPVIDLLTPVWDARIPVKNWIIDKYEYINRETSNLFNRIRK